MRIIILTQYYLPETGAPQNRLSDMAQRLAAMGNVVRVLTAKPNYPLGCFYPKFEKGLWKFSSQNGVKVTHCWLYPTRSKRISLRLLNYFSFVFSATIIGSLILPRADILIVESPPLFLGITAWWLSRLKRAHIIFNVSDLIPETAIALGYLKNKSLRKILYCLEAWCYKNSALITGQTQGIVDSIACRFPDKKVYFLTNGVDTSKFDYVSQENKCLSKEGRPFIIGYAGIIGHAQGFDDVVKAAKLLNHRTRKVKFVLYGDGPLRESLRKTVRGLGLTNIEFPGHRRHEEIIKIMHSWDAGIVPLKNLPIFTGALPSKMFEIMASGLPVILFAPEGEASRLITRANAGVWIEAGDEKALTEKVLELSANRRSSHTLGMNGYQFVRDHYDRAKIIDDFKNQFDFILNASDNLQ